MSAAFLFPGQGSQVPVMLHAIRSTGVSGAPSNGCHPSGMMRLWT